MFYERQTEGNRYVWMVDNLWASEHRYGFNHQNTGEKMKDKSPYFFVIAVIWIACFVLSELFGSYDFMYVAVAATLFILAGAS